MSDLRRRFVAAARATEPRSGAVERLVARQEFPGKVLHDTVWAPRLGALERLLARRSVVRRRPRRRVLALALVALAAAAASWLSRPPPRIDGRLDAEHEVHRALSKAIGLGYTGHGALSGTSRHVHIFWEVGTLEVAVRLNSGVDLEVETSEGHVAVTGADFTLTRGPLGTAVSVQSGPVRVSCGGTSATLGKGGEELCLPVRAAGMLGRAQALRAGGAGNDAVLEAVDRGLSLAGPGDPATGELVALRLDALIRAGRYPEARAAAEAYLQTGETARREEVQEILRALREIP